MEPLGPPKKPPGEATSGPLQKQSRIPKGELNTKIDKLKVNRFTKEQRGMGETTLRSRARAGENNPNPVTSFPETFFLTKQDALALVQGTPFTLDKIPVLYAKDEILSALRVVAANTGDPQVKQATNLYINALLKIAKQYISKGELPKNFPDDYYLIDNKITAYISSGDLVRKYGADSSLEKLIKAFAEKQHWDPEVFFVKKDPESDTEIKAKKVVALLTKDYPLYESFIVTKFKGSLPDTIIGNPSGHIPLQKADSVIFSRAQSGLPFDIDLFDKFQKKQTEGTKALFLQQAGKAAVEAAAHARALKALGGKESIPFHALMDCLLFSFDSHENQYVGVKNESGETEFFNIDFARTLPAHETTKINTLEGPKVRCFLRSLFLGHPFSSLPLPQPLVEMIKGWDIPAIEKQLRKDLVGSSDTFKAMEKELDQIALLEKNKTTLTNEERMSLEERKQKAEQKLESEFFGKIHPNGFSLLLNRLKAAQEYVKEAEHKKMMITVSDIFSKTSPQIALFLHVLKRMTPHATQTLGVDLLTEEESQVRYLEDILRDARIQKLATEDELVRMERALRDLHQEAGTVASYRMTST